MSNDEYQHQTFQERYLMSDLINNCVDKLQKYYEDRNKWFWELNCEYKNKENDKNNKG